MFGKKENKNHCKQYFTIYDSKIGVYKEPMLAFNQHDMLRQIDTILRDPAREKNQLWMNAEDFSLFLIGDYDQFTGTITPCLPTHIANLHDIRAAIQREQVTPAYPSHLERNVSEPVLNDGPRHQ